MRAGRYALEHKKPMLGICKGNQLLNVLMGGSLYQDLSLKGPDCIRHLQLGRRDYLTHQIRVEEGTRLSKLLGSGVCMTNSMHHQSVKELGKGLRASAYANDGIIEAIEDQEGLIVGVQWHPESLLESAPAMNHLFSDLCGRALERKSREFIISIENHHRMLTNLSVCWIEVEAAQSGSLTETECGGPCDDK